MSRLRAGEWTAAVGAAALLGTLFLPWFGADLGTGWTYYGPPSAVRFASTHAGWKTLGWLTLVFCFASIAAGAWLFVATAVGHSLAQLVAAAVLTAAVGTFALIALALRVLVFQPGPNEIVTVRYGAWLGLLAAVAVMVGGWWAIKDERTAAPESAYTPPEPRPAPPPRLTGTHDRS